MKVISSLSSSRKSDLILNMVSLSSGFCSLFTNSCFCTEPVFSIICFFRFAITATLIPPATATAPAIKSKELSLLEADVPRVCSWTAILFASLAIFSASINRPSSYTVYASVSFASESGVWIPSFLICSIKFLVSSIVLDADSAEPDTPKK